jgi:hypothetical protein
MRNPAAELADAGLSLDMLWTAWRGLPPTSAFKITEA